MRFGFTLITALFITVSGFAQDGVREGDDRPENIPSGYFLSPENMSVDLRQYDVLDADRKVADRPLEQAVRFYELNKSKIRNQRYITIVDLSQHSGKARMSLVDMSTGEVRRFTVSHGKGSDADNDGWATKFSNVSGSNMSSIGFYLTGGLYDGRNGRSMYLHGLEKTNSNAYQRAIVMHGADYVTPTRAGRSLGCPAIERRYVPEWLPKLQGGSLLYVYYNQ
ncbi:MAG: murein L,D-transpeptidase catalytic domain family protein [Bdellovibrionaceae bacterium]|nr:murein L,D-transpeptidase catalytic domain family protein [Pseudobdellovibrionaceae bacterium]MBX3033313.1 murein L,D-transpeptidase catalytic domain family protein [Pseudobdellovibrionaceae bacterium]